MKINVHYEWMEDHFRGLYLYLKKGDVDVWCNGSKVWRDSDAISHRVGGPAVIHSSGLKRFMCKWGIYRTMSSL